MKRNITTQSSDRSGCTASEFFGNRSSAGSFKADPGLQLYSLRDDLKKDVPGTLKKVQGFGIRLVELAGTYELPPAKFKELLTAHGLQPVSCPLWLRAFPRRPGRSRSRGE